ncbi:MAG: Mrp/NBP35 family ATP-binding protein [Victivallaceae bacterium]|nr:Mrp/NBP35 family ATP-binding protein [Victivallaceae bacterium]
MSDCSGECGSCGAKGSCASAGKPEKIMTTVKKAVLVLSGKGGVGKSTVAASLALELAASGKKVGLLDVDFHGPSQPTLFGVSHLRMEGVTDGMLPMEVAGGVKLVSLGLLMDDSDRAVIWRGPVKMGVIKQLLTEVVWGDLDYLVLDFPPGTGDESLSACQLVDCPKCAVVVTTPQEVALADCRKCVDFCTQLELPVAAVVENMSYFVCPGCGGQHRIFGEGGGALLARVAGAPLAAKLPLIPAFMASCDRGEIIKGLAANADFREGIDAVVKLCSKDLGQGGAK